MKRARAYIGTSGWNYRDWKERYYPRRLKQGDWLHYLSRDFDTVELNASFYRIPKPEMVERWHEQTPSRFRFAVKLWRAITHYKRLKDCGEQIENFLAPFDPLPVRKRAPLLIQLPPGQGKDTDRLKRFLEELKKRARGWKLAVEFRNDEWLCEEVYALLNRQRAALCLHDMRGYGDAEEPNQASFVYLRRHGPSERKYSGCYAQHQIKRDARLIRGRLDNGQTVFAYYNNDIEGHAVRNADQLRRELRELSRAG